MLRNKIIVWWTCTAFGPFSIDLMLQTVLCGMDSRCFHLGYYRDDPKEMPVFVASNILNSKNPEKNGELKVTGQNIFAALQWVSLNVLFYKTFSLKQLVLVWWFQQDL